MITIPTPIPESSATNDIVRVALNRGPGVTVARIAQEFGAHVGTLDTWIRHARNEAGEHPGVTRSDIEELKELRKRKRNRLLEQEKEVLRRAVAHRANALFHAHRDDPEFGHRLLADEAKACGQAMFNRTAWWICLTAGGSASRKHAAIPSGLALRDNVVGCVVHSGRGAQLRSRKYVRTLKHQGLVGSMGRFGAAGDKAAMESYFSSLQNNVLDRKPWGTRQEL